MRYLYTYLLFLFYSHFLLSQVARYNENSHIKKFEYFILIRGFKLNLEIEQAKKQILDQNNF